MLQMIMTQRARVLAATLAILFLPVAAQAGTINMILSGFNVQYFNGADSGAGAIYDSVGHVGGAMAPSNADLLSSVTFQLDGDDKGTLVNPPDAPMYGDLRIDGIGNPLGLNYQPNLGSNGGLFGFDWFTPAGLAGDYLQLGMTSVNVLTLPNPGTFFFTGTATLLDQSLPFGLEFTSNTVVFSFTATQVSFPFGVDANSTEMVVALGALTITGEGDLIVPEPTAIVLGCMVVGCGLLPRRRRKA